MRTPLAIAISTIIGLASWATYRQTDTNLIGKLPDGATRIVTGWKIKPAGTSILLPDMLQRAALAPDGKTLAVISGGAGLILYSADYAAAGLLLGLIALTSTRSRRSHAH